MLNFYDVVSIFLKFKRETFGEMLPETSLLKCKEEIEETIIALGMPLDRRHTAEEYADMIGCIFGSADDAGFSAVEIIQAWSEKTEKNMKRKWIKLPNGTMGHAPNDWEDQKQD